MSPVTDGTVTRERTAVELVKEASAHLRGSIAEELRAAAEAARGMGGSAKGKSPKR